jgi:hypothetical protein
MKPGQPNQLPLTVTNGILGGGGFGTRLMQNLREDKAYTYGCYSGIDITDNGSWFSASGNFRNDVTDSAIVQILKELDNIGNSYVKESEINLTKSAMAGGFARSLENPQTIARFALNIIQNNLPKDYYQTYLSNIYNIKTRKYNVKALLPISLLTSIKLNNRLVIRDKRYVINNITIDLTSGEVNFELISDSRIITQAPAPSIADYSDIDYTTDYFI